MRDVCVYILRCMHRERTRENGKLKSVMSSHMHCLKRERIVECKVWMCKPACVCARRGRECVRVCHTLTAPMSMSWVATSQHAHSC